VLAALAALLVLVPSAVAHGGSGKTGYASKVRTVVPEVSGLSVTVKGGDDRLRLTNGTGRDVVVLGYAHEPYLRFTGNAVYLNARSPASFLNILRYGGVPVPKSADPKAPPQWEKVSDTATYEWHDRRIHWRTAAGPAIVRGAPGARHHIFDWSVPLRVGGTQVAVRGSLDYAPVSAQWQRWAVIVGVQVVVLAGILVLVLRRRAVRPRAPAPA
jgi:hypothetical protein